MRPSLAVLATLAATAGLGFAALPAMSAGAAKSSQRDDPRTCNPRGAQTLLANGRARIFALRNGGTRQAFGCARGGVRPRFLFGTADTGPLFRLTGRRVAFLEADCSPGGCDAAIFLVDLRRRSARRTIVEVPGFPTDLEVASNQAVAWITQLPGSPGAQEYEVGKLDADGQSTLDAGLGIDPRSLAVSGSTLYWTHGGQPRSTTLKRP